MELVARAALPFEDSLRARIHGVVGGPVLLRDLVRLDVEIGERFARAALEVMRRAGVASASVEGIGSHGQTVGHFPEPDVRGTLQIGSAAVIHARTGVPVVYDFRSADLAVGGQGAPLTPFVHQLLFRSADEDRAVLNIGGFCNVTWLPARRDEGLVAFDPGPGNALLDRAARLASGGRERFDREGERARRGRVLEPVLQSLLADPYFDKPPPKSTGHEHFGEPFFERAHALARDAGGGPDDLVATLAALTVESVARAAERFLPQRPARWLVCGGGACNPALLDGLRLRVAPAAVETTAAHGVPVDALEAIAFAVLGHAASRGGANHLPETTGASRPVVLGAVTPPNAFAARRR
jgi:anhydro-N-acetylmuramic acid kinase